MGRVIAPDNPETWRSPPSGLPAVRNDPERRADDDRRVARLAPAMTLLQRVEAQHAKLEAGYNGWQARRRKVAALRTEAVRIALEAGAGENEVARVMDLSRARVRLISKGHQSLSLPTSAPRSGVLLA